MSAKPGLDQIRAAPKVLLHDHLDGGLRPATVVELAAEQGYRDLPTTDPQELAAWFVSAAPRRDLVRYLEGFVHTVGVMQTSEALDRVAHECVEDLAEDGVVYAEVRFAPELHTERGLTLDEVVESVLAGFDDAMARAAAAGRPIVVRALLTAMRTAARSPRDRRARGALPGRQASPASTSRAPRRAIRPRTTSTRSISCNARTSMRPCTPVRRSAFPRSGRRSSGATPRRLGHGVRIVDDIVVDPDGGVRSAGWRRT